MSQNFQVHLTFLSPALGVGLSIAATGSPPPGQDAFQASVVMSSDQSLPNPAITLISAFGDVYLQLGLLPGQWVVALVYMVRVTQPSLNLFSYAFQVGFARAGSPTAQSFRGPQGPAGPQGQAGPLGPPGPPGVTAAAGQNVLASDTVSLPSYGDLATPGPSVSLTTGTSVLVTVSATLSKPSSGNTAYASFAVSGASLISATDSVCAQATSYGAGSMSVSRTSLVSGLTPGANTFAMKYRADGSSFTVSNRSISVVPIP